MSSSSRHFLTILTIAGGLLGWTRPAAAQVTVPIGFEATEYHAGPDANYFTSLAFDGDGVLYVGEADVLTSTGRVWRLADVDADGVVDDVREFARDLGMVTGLAFRGLGFPLPPAAACSASSGPTSSGAGTDLERIRSGQFAGVDLPLYVSHFRPGPGGTGTISRLQDVDRDGLADVRDDIVTGLPSDGQNGNQQIAVGPDGHLYFGMGARTNNGIPGTGPADGPLNGTILRVAADGSGLEIYARGLRNAYDLAFRPDGSLLATENGPDASGPAPVVGAPDELNPIHPGGDYGWPDHHGFPPIGSGTIGPIALFAPGTSTDGIALVTPASWCGFAGGLIAAQFGSFTDPLIGRRLVLVRLLEPQGLLVDVFATGFGRPLDVAFGPDGALYVADFSNAFLAPRSARILRIAPIDADADSVPDICQPTPILPTHPADSLLPTPAAGHK